MAYDIEVKELPARSVATVRVTTTPDKMGQAFGEVLPQVFEYLKSQGIEPSGSGFGIFYAYDADRADMDIGLPVDRDVEGNGRVVGQRLEAATFAVTWHEGSYQKIGEAHRAVEEWIKANDREAAGPPWEVYWTGPAQGGPPAGYRTEVGYPIR